MSQAKWSPDEARANVSTDRLELWGGVECTRNRVANRYFDQLALTGHVDRIEDLDLFHSIGLRTIRYPILWETTAPYGIDRADFRAADERLAKLRALGISPIVGLVHHGSGPPDTSLLDPAFPERVAVFARAVAERYPWLRRFTPINEPVTTARFAGLYGHWYPHRRDDPSFARMVLHQCRAVALSMRAIREVIPDAELVHIDDGGHTSGTSRLDYQVAFENHRRWLGFDLLAGRVTTEHPLFEYLRGARIELRELDEFVREPCLPDIVGLNYYVTSDRFLDHRVDLHPPAARGGNGREVYADLETVRVFGQRIYGHRALLVEAWERYGLPVALTEVHLGCTREEQLRWLFEAWSGAVAARRDGADVRAVTAWALLGSMDWDSLVTRHAGHYEPGAFDVRAPMPRRTAIATAIEQLATGDPRRHPVVQGSGWWHPSSRVTPVTNDVSSHERHRPRPLLICGNGTLARALAQACGERGLAHRLLRRAEMDIVRPSSVRDALKRFRPWAVVNAAGFVRVDEAERNVVECMRDNLRGPVTLARLCERHDARFLTFSSDLIFDGKKRSPYVESDRPAPLSVYGRSKCEAEREVLAAMKNALIVRTSAFFGPNDVHNFVTSILAALEVRRPVDAANDCFVSPTYVPDLAHASLDLLIDDECGIRHLANEGETSWFDWAVDAAERAGHDVALVRSRRAAELPWIAERPSYSVLGTERGRILPSLNSAMDRYFTARAAIEGISERTLSAAEFR